MRNVIAIFLLVLLGFNQTSLGQLLKVPALIGHFNKHRDENKISFLEFLDEHYSPGHDDADNSEDAKLPFKASMPSGSSIALAPASCLPDFDLSPRETCMIDHIHPAPPQHQPGNIFHPPKA